MESVKLGKSDIQVSRIFLGCVWYGKPTERHPWALGEEASEELLQHALDNGINFFDTAMSYAEGTSEIFLGKFIKKCNKRKEIVLATKFTPRSEEERLAGTDGKQHVLNCLEGSLKRLDTDYVDLYILHMWDFHTPIEEIMEGLSIAVKQGKARAIGISNCYAWQLEKANAIAEKNGWPKFVSVQGHYNLMFREEEREMNPCCRAEGIALTPYSPLASGRLVKPKTETSKRLQMDTFAKSKYDRTAAQDEVIIDRVAEVAKKNGLTTTQVALGWLLSKTDAPVIGATKLYHIDEAVNAVGVSLSAEDMAYLEEPYVPHALVGVMAINK
ncbi:MAG: aldo/keto reductase [Clostridiales bacterium]|nr:aldo/keto reductase [Clostridiales bacterium]